MHRPAKALFAAASLLGLAVACGGREPPPKLVPAAPPAMDPPVVTEVASACARLTACTRDAARFRDPAACVEWWLSDAPAPLRACLGGAGSCEDVARCMRGGGDARAAAFCAQRQGVVSGCEGGRLVSCGQDDAHESTVVDCAAAGASCREVKTGGLVMRTCWSAEACPAGAPDTRCDGPGAVLTCRDGALERVACAAGTACEERAAGGGDVVARCELADGGGCGVRATRSCEGDRLIQCDRTESPGAVRVTDCKGFGLRCVGLGPRAGCAVPAGAECDNDLLPRCDGESLVFCAAGRLAKVSCSALGLGACEPSARGAVAGCAPAASEAAPAR